MSYTASKAVSVAKKEIGYRESGNNLTKYNKWLGKISGYPHDGYGYPWCASFQSWIVEQAGGKPGVDAPRTAGCAVAVSWFRSRGRFYGRTSTPKVGDWVFYGSGGSEHVELVVEVSGSSIVTIGGNTTGNIGDGNYANGDAVARKTVSRSNSRIYGYGRPAYAGSSAAPYKWGGQAPEPFLRRGDVGDRVRDLQNALLKVGEKLPRYGADGDFGSETEAAVKSYQRRRGLEVDGVYGPLTKGKLAADLSGAPAESKPAAPAKPKVTVPSGSPLLRKGSKGTRVKQLQQALIAAGHKLPKYGADGDFGPETEAALRAFQKKHRLLVDGVYGPQSAKKLAAVLS